MTIIGDSSLTSSDLTMLGHHIPGIEVFDIAGIPNQTLARVFEPFFTTKDAGRGSGLGPSQVYGFVRQSGGHAAIYAEVGEGTTVRLDLPRHTWIDTAAAAGQEAHPVIADNQKLVLIVEDDEDVRTNTVMMVRELDYDVLEASDGNAALSVVEKQPGRVARVVEI